MSRRSSALVCAALFIANTALAADTDGDGVDDTVDNCSQLANPDQRDTNGDGFGNACDTDLNDDMIVNFIDLGILRTVFFSTDEDADINGDGTVNIVDLGAMRTQFFSPPGPGATTPQGFGQRPILADFDFDTNGSSDATSQISYDGDGNVTQQIFTLIDDGTPDDFNPISDAGFTANYTYTDGRLTQFTQDNDTDGNDFQSDYTYNADGTLDTATTLVFDAGGTTISTLLINFVYANGLRIRDDWSVPGFGLVLTATHTYDADGLIEQSDWVNAGGAPGGQQYLFSWNAEGKLVQRATDFQRDGIFDEILNITHAGGVPVLRELLGSPNTTPANYTETPTYGGNGRLEQVDYDANIDGSVDAVATAVWEDGPCKKFFLPTLIPTNNAGSDGDPDSASGDVLFCGP
ncbi:MAG: hypothetical protein AB8G16_11885 [Gammaproteobacteria bacterium]